MIGTTKVTTQAVGRYSKVLALGLCTALLGMVSAQAGVTLNSARVGAAMSETSFLA